MSVELDVAADLTFEVAVGEGGDARTVHGSLKGSGRALVLEVDDPSAFAGRGDAPVIRALADTLAGRGIRIEVCSGDTHLITLGATRSPWWQRRVTGSRHIRLGSLRGVWTSARSRASTTDRPVLPDSTLTPPVTVLPLAPTFMRRPRRPVGTTHAPSGSGMPRLVLAPRDESYRGERLPNYWLAETVTTIGSGQDCDIRLAGLQELHAEIRHDGQDEYVLVSHTLDTRVNGERVRQAVLRTASRVQVGGHVLTYYREEYADHGRPYGGRVGGELGRQRPQPPRHPTDSPPEAS